MRWRQCHVHRHDALAERLPCPARRDFKGGGQDQGDIQKAMHAKSIAEIERALRAYGSAQDRPGDQVAALQPPVNAQAANSELARGEHDTATEVRAVLPKLAGFNTPKSALPYINKQLGNAKGGNEEDQAITKLKKLGYTKGS